MAPEKDGNVPDRRTMLSRPASPRSSGPTTDRQEHATTVWADMGSMPPQGGVPALTNPLAATDHQYGLPAAHPAQGSLPYSLFLPSEQGRPSSESAPELALSPIHQYFQPTLPPHRNFGFQPQQTTNNHNQDAMTPHTAGPGLGLSADALATMAAQQGVAFMPTGISQHTQLRQVRAPPLSLPHLSEVPHPQPMTVPGASQLSIHGPSSALAVGSTMRQPPFWSNTSDFPHHAIVQRDEAFARVSAAAQPRRPAINLGSMRNNIQNTQHLQSQVRADISGPSISAVPAPGLNTRKRPRAESSPPMLRRPTPLAASGSSLPPAPADILTSTLLHRVPDQRPQHHRHRSQPQLSSQDLGSAPAVEEIRALCEFLRSRFLLAGLGHLGVPQELGSGAQYDQAALTPIRRSVESLLDNFREWSNRHTEALEQLTRFITELLHAQQRIEEYLRTRT